MTSSSSSSTIIGTVSSSTSTILWMRMREWLIRKVQEKIKKMSDFKKTPRLVRASRARVWQEEWEPVPWDYSRRTVCTETADQTYSSREEREKHWREAKLQKYRRYQVHYYGSPTEKEMAKWECCIKELWVCCCVVLLCCCAIVVVLLCSAVVVVLLFSTTSNVSILHILVYTEGRRD